MRRPRRVASTMPMVSDMANRVRRLLALHGDFIGESGRRWCDRCMIDREAGHPRFRAQKQGRLEDFSGR